MSAQGIHQRSPVLDRLADKFDVTSSGCWEWTGQIGAQGYGVAHHQGRHPAHRLMWETVVGAVPEGMVLDHLCDNRRCVNPDHLNPTTHRANILRGTSPNAIAHRTGTCRQGHALDYTNPTTGRRRCRTCDTNGQRLRRAAKGA
jgi:hypothetical protein